MCGHRNRYRYVASEPPDRIGARDRDMRASQEEREGLVELLRTHAGEGRLDYAELEQRVEVALSARTRGELDALLADLPGERARPQRRRAGVGAIASGSVAAVLPLVAGIAILVLGPPGVAWIGWTAIGWWFFAGLPSAGVGFGWCGHVSRQRPRGTVV